MKNKRELLNFDKNHIWHPYAKIPAEPPTIGIKKTQGSTLTLFDDREVIDGMSSWWSTLHGYNHPQIIKAMQQQLDTMPHVMFGGLTHEPAIILAKKLIELTPQNLNKVFFADSGSVAMEVAIKIALQYWISSKKPNKNKLITVKNGYHGDTFATMAICDPINGMHNLFSEVISKHYFAPAPENGFSKQSNNEDLIALKEIIKNNHQNIAAMTIEPIVQGAGGMRFYRPDYLKQVRQLCDEFNILLIVDEIATGFGRTGKLFACEWANINPDIMTIGKALTGGHISLAATLTTSKISKAISQGNPGILAHGPTFMANPLACTAAIASIEVLLSYNWQADIQRIEKHFNDTLMPIKNIKGIKEVRVLGAIAVIELERANLSIKIQQEALKHNVWIRPFGKLVYSLPAFNIPLNQLKQLTHGMIMAVQTVLKKQR